MANWAKRRLGKGGLFADQARGPLCSRVLQSSAACGLLWLRWAEVGAFAVPVNELLRATCPKQGRSGPDKA